jgi:crotonobetainyl-CoA:carnitine CoA-transferase CaiB-like acyl-CoA transferase
MHLTGEPAGPPSRLGAPSIIDQTTGLTAAVGLLSAVFQARNTGKGCDVDTCLLDVALHQLGYTAIWYLNEGHMSTRQERSAHFSVAPVQTFPTADGWIFIMCMTDKFWGALVDALGRSDLKTDARFSQQAARQENRDALTQVLDAELRKHSTQHWLSKLGGLLPVAPVFDLEQALENPFLRETEMISNVPHPARPGMRALANPLKIDGRRIEQTVCSPVGADNAELLAGMASRARATTA